MHEHGQTHGEVRREEWPPLAALRDPLCQSLRSDGTSYSERFGCHHRAQYWGGGGDQRKRGRERARGEVEATQAFYMPEKTSDKKQIGAGRLMPALACGFMSWAGVDASASQPWR
jgi:hypothetical protein